MKNLSQEVRLRNGALAKIDLYEATNRKYTVRLITIRLPNYTITGLTSWFSLSYLILL